MLIGILGLNPRMTEEKGGGEGERDKDEFALPGPLIYERVTNLKIP